MHSTTIRVYYEDTDMAGVVYYANYLRYLERGRSEAVRAAGVAQLDLRDRHGLVFVVRRVEADYLSPARYDDLLTVETRFEAVRGARFTVPQRILRGAEPILTARIDCAVMTLEGRPARLPAEIGRALGSLMS